MKTTYSTFMETLFDKTAPFLNECHKPTLAMLFSDQDRISSISEMLIDYNYLDEKKYVEVANKIYNNCFVKNYIVLEDKDYIENLPATHYSNVDFNDKLLSDILDKLLKHNVMLYKLDTTIKKVYLLIKEPNHFTQDENFNSTIIPDEVVINLDLIKNIAQDLTRYLGFNIFSLTFVSSYTFKNLIPDYCNKFKITPKDRLSRTTIDGKYFIRQIVAEGIALHSSDVAIWCVELGDDVRLCWGYTVLGTYLGHKEIKCTRTFLEQASTEAYIWVNKDASGKHEIKVRDGDADVLVHLPEYRGRINFLPGASFDPVNIRVIPRKISVVPYANLNITPELKNEIRDAVIYNSSGIIVIAGAVGSGKSTLLRSLLKLINEERPTDRCESIDSPIEAIVDGVCHVNLGEGSNINPADILKALTRRAARVVNINEINTSELMELTITSAVMNLLALTTIHTESVSAMPDRIKGFSNKDNFLFRQFLYNSRVFAHLTMLKKCCPNCTQSVTVEDPLITTDLVAVFKKYGYDKATYPLTRPKKDCELCNGTGILVHNPIICVELLKIDNKFITQLTETPDHEIRRLIRKTLMSSGRTGVHDAIRYLEMNQLDVLQIYKAFSLVNSIGEDLDRDKLTPEQIASLK